MGGTGRFGKDFPPRSIAIVGVSQKDEASAPGYTGLKLFRILREAGFEGPLYPINPRVTAIDGVRAYRSLKDLPERPDLVTVAVRAGAVPGVLEDCVAVGVTNVHITSSGFGETGESERAQLESRIREIATRGELRVVGPNCMGFHVPSARMKMFEEVAMDVGSVAFVSQSGGHALVFLKHGPDFALGFSKVISYGNALTLEASDFLEYLAGDPETGIICMYLEGIRDGRRLLELARQTTPRKPVVIWKGGLTPTGARAAASHTGSLAGEVRVWDAFFEQTGAIRVGAIEEMAEVAMTLLRMDVPPAPRVVVLSCGGGTNVATGDICAREGLALPPLAPETREQLLEFITSVNQGVTNPADLAGVLSDLPLLERTLDVLARDPRVDVVILHMSGGFFSGPLEGAVEDFERILRTRTQEGSGRGAVVVAMDESYRYQGTDRWARRFRRAGIVTYGSLRGACRALLRVAGYQAFLSEVT